jgi:glutamate synthase (NADPH/NADH) large chain
MGFRKFEDIIGRSDLIEIDQSKLNDKTAGLDFGKLLHRVDSSAPIRKQRDQKHNIFNVLDRELIAATKYAVDSRQPISLSYDIVNTNRAVGAMLSGHITEEYGAEGLPDGTLNITFKGSAGQSFGAFLMKGVNFKLEGEANDYIGKGLSGGRIAICPPAESKFEACDNIIAGNTILYGATSGEIFINGRVGERFAVRNSGATAVVEGTGDHCCEYMTGGRVVVLGTTGRNFAAGMSGGLAYVWDKNHDFDYYCNMDMIELDLIEDKAGRDELHSLIEKHYKYTGSALAKKMLDNWSQYVGEFIQVTPIEYRRILQEERMKALQQKIDNVQRDY